MNPAGFILVAVGLFSLAGGLLNWKWFMNTRRASALVRAISHKGARLFYVILGIIVAKFGLLITFGVIG